VYPAKVQFAGDWLVQRLVSMERIGQTKSQLGPVAQLFTR
jgi:hypothetical protein